MRKIMLVVLILFFCISLLFIGTGCNTEEIELLTKELEDITEQKKSVENDLADAEGNIQDLQGEINLLEEEIVSLKSIKNIIAFIIDEGGKPLSGATVTLNETGDEIIVGDSGKVDFIDVSDDTAVISINAQGYFLEEETVSLEEGSNGILINMERDPFGLIPSEVGLEGETPLYIEDFQDGMAQGWPEIEENSGGWSVQADPDTEGNFILVASEPTGVQARLFDYKDSSMIFDNAVWRFKTKYTGDGSLSLFLWKLQMDNSDIYYGAMFGQQTGLGGPLDIPRPSPEEWHTIEMSSFNGVVEFWVDGREIATYEDTDPLPGGLIGLAFHGGETAGEFYYDDISVCELSAPFKSVFAAAE